MATDAAPGKGAGSLLTRKFGPLPAWGWLAVAVVGYVLWRKYSGSTSGSAASTGLNSATGSTATGVPTETLTLPNGESYTGPVGYGPPGQGGSTPGNTKTAAPPAAKAPSGPINTKLAKGQKKAGGGYTDPNQIAIQSGGYTYNGFATAEAASNYIKQGGTVYAEVSPGVFNAVPENSPELKNTFLYDRA